MTLPGVRVWTVDLDAPLGEPEAPQAMLSAEERERVARLRSPRARVRRARAAAAVRIALGLASGRDPAQLRITRRPGGKPAVAGGPEFSLSHAGGMALVAVAAAGVVGVDIEPVRPRRGIDRVARGLFTDAERAAMEGVGEEHRLERFYELWTAREAYVKAIGRGLGAAGESFRLPLPGAAWEAPAEIEEAGQPRARLALRRFSPAQGFMGAVVAESLGHGLVVEPLASQP